MSRALRLLACTAFCWAALAGVASASCASEAELQREAIADFDVHVVEVRRGDGTVEVDAVRRGDVKVGDLVPVVEHMSNTSLHRPLRPGQRLRMLPRTRARPIQVIICNAWLLPGHVDVSAPVDEAGGFGATGIAAVLAGLAAILGFVLVKRRRDAL